MTTATKTPAGHMLDDAHISVARGTKSDGRTANRPTKTILRSPPAVSQLDRGHVGNESQDVRAPVKPLPAGQSVSDDHDEPARGNQLAGATNRAAPMPVPPRQPLREGHACHAAHEDDALPNQLLSAGRGTGDAQRVDARAELLFAAEFLDDTERVRIATENRLRAMCEPPKGLAGKKLVAWAEANRPEWSAYAKQAAAMIAIEHEAELVLARVLRRHPLGPWVKATRGVGEKQAARLIAAIGDVAWNHLEDRPRRGPAELWAYCGYVPGQRRKKGVKSNWSAVAKSRSYVIAESMLKAGNRDVYDAARANKDGFVHDAPCQICAGKGKPAESAIGTPWKDGHAHAHALRLTAKAMLRDLFVEARRVGA